MCYFTKLKDSIRLWLWRILGIKYYNYLKNQNILYLNDCDDIEIGKGTYNNGAKVWRWGKKSKLKIGSYCSIANDVSFILDSGFHNFFNITQYPLADNLFKDNEPIFIDEQYTTKANIKANYPKEKLEIIIGNDVWIGANVTILPGVIIGNCCTIMAGAVVTKSFDDFSIIAGIPAIKIGSKIDDELQGKFLRIAWWNWNEDKIKQNIADFNLSYIDFIEKHFSEI